MTVVLKLFWAATHIRKREPIQNSVRSKSFTTLDGRSSSFQFVLLRRPCRVSASFLSTDTDQISLLRSEITQVPSLRKLLDSSKKYTIVFDYVTSYAIIRIRDNQDPCCYHCSQDKPN
ncbi:hypothetical protein T02_11759 [Trichinella nativa]|uniref:Uncharacterized protein n=1 Tax=Trichinella nativa TaxID=6335 RepID=A0A0V1KPY2_9BILA|nr:hypothetical protein T02_11759 [Trichinella nativa]